MEKEEVIRRFGFDPDTAGNRPRGWWIVNKIEEEEEAGNAKVGYLCVKTRDGGSNPIDASACKKSNFVGTSEDSFDETYRYYFYAPLAI